MSLRVSICGLGGVICEVDGDLSSMVLRLKQGIHAATRIPVKEQRLLAGCDELRSTMLLGVALGENPLSPTVITLIRRHAEHAEWTLAAMSHERGLRDLPADAR